MGKLIYSMITSLDGYVSGPDGGFGFLEPDEELHAFINERFAPVGTYLYGRRMYETMVFWETAHALPDEPPVVAEYARIWQAADKVVYSTTLDEVASAKTRLERAFDADAVRRLKAESPADITVDGPTLAAHAVRAGLVDEYQVFLGPTLVGGGKAFFPSDVSVELELLDHRSFASGVVCLRYRAKR